MIGSMAVQDQALDGADGVCWQCGAPALANCAYSLKLVAPAGRGLDAMGYPVTPGRRLNTVRVAVPRCIACRGRSQDAIVITFACMFAGAIIAPILQAYLWPHIELPPWLHVLNHRSSLGSASAIGVVIGALVAISGVALARRRRGLRALNAYPPVIALRQAGWQYPASSSS
jgi:hypothetical protein